MLHKLAFFVCHNGKAVLHNVVVAVFSRLAQNSNIVLATEFFA